MNLKRAIKGRVHDEALIDYIMAEKFGLNWKKYETKRISYFLIIYKLLELEQINQQKNGR